MENNETQVAVFKGIIHKLTTALHAEHPEGLPQPYRDLVKEAERAMDAPTSAEVFPGATKEEIASVMMQDLVGEYEVPENVPEWAWVEREASFNHCRNGEDGIWEFVLNLSRTFDDVPEKLKTVIAQSRAAGMNYLIIHQGT